MNKTIDCKQYPKIGTLYFKYLNLFYVIFLLLNWFQYIFFYFSIYIVTYLKVTIISTSEHLVIGNKQ